MSPTFHYKWLTELMLNHKEVLMWKIFGKFRSNLGWEYTIFLKGITKHFRLINRWIISYKQVKWIRIFESIHDYRSL